MRRRNQEWEVPEPPQSWEQVIAAVLMDIRDELRHLNTTFDCENFLDVPRKLDRIAKNTAKPRKRKKAKP